MKKWIPLLLAVAFMTCSGFICTGSQIHRFKEANADLSSGLAKLTKTTLELNQQGTMPKAEADAILLKVLDATVLSDRMEDCANAVSAKNTIVGCVTPLLKSARDDIDQAALGVKTVGAQATMQSALNVAISAADSIARLAGK